MYMYWIYVLSICIDKNNSPMINGPSVKRLTCLLLIIPFHFLSPKFYHIPHRWNALVIYIFILQSLIRDMSYQQDGITQLTKDWLEVCWLFFLGMWISCFFVVVEISIHHPCPNSLCISCWIHILSHHLHQRVSNLYIHWLFPKIIHLRQTKIQFWSLTVRLGDKPKHQFVLPL
jgi:hypothetical protein